MDPVERGIAESLRRRAEDVPAAPLGYTDVQRRILQRRRRTATFAAAAVTLPAVVGLGYLAGRRSDGGAVANGGPATLVTTLPVVTSTTPALLSDDAAPTDAWASYRCQVPVATDAQWHYFQYCEYVEGPGAPTPWVDPGIVLQTTTTMTPPTTTTTTLPMPTTTLLPSTTTSPVTVDPEVLAAQVLVLDASGGAISVVDVAARLGVSPRYAAVATRTIDETLVMPVGPDVVAAFALLEFAGIGGFDTWTPDLLAEPVPDGVTVVLVVGRDGFPVRP
jgi:hypothetical protein